MENHTRTHSDRIAANYFFFIITAFHTVKNERKYVLKPLRGQTSRTDLSVGGIKQQGELKWTLQERER